MVTIKPKGHEAGQDASGRLFDTLLSRQGFTRDNQLAEWLGYHRTAISNIRRGAQPVSAPMRDVVAEKAGMTLEQVERLIRQPRFRTQQKGGA